MAVKGGSALQDLSYTKDMRIAKALVDQGIEPENWKIWADDEHNAFAQKLGYKAFGKGGKLGRQSHAEGVGDVADRMREILGRR